MSKEDFWDDSDEDDEAEDYASIKAAFDGQMLLGFMPLDIDKEWEPDCDAAIALYIGKADAPSCVVLWTPNQEYSRFDKWEVKVLKTPFPRDERYKSIGERMELVVNKKSSKTWYKDDTPTVQFTLKTPTKELRFGHHWNDCHYPNSIWEAL